MWGGYLRGGRLTGQNVDGFCAAVSDLTAELNVFVPMVFHDCFFGGKYETINNGFFVSVFPQSKELKITLHDKNI